MVKRIGLDGIGYVPTRSRNTTYIQNNFYGTSMFSANTGLGNNGCCCCNNFGYIGNSCFSSYGSIGYPPPGRHYDYSCCNSSGDISNFNKWMLGLGVGAEIIGIGIKAFSNNKV